MCNDRPGGVVVTVPRPASAHTCSIPVFRYALERWIPGPYEVLVYHRGPLSEADRKTLKEMEDFC